MGADDEARGQAEDDREDEPTDNAGAGVIECSSLGKGAGGNRVMCLIWSLGRWLIPNGINTRNDVPGDGHDTAHARSEECWHQPGFLPLERNG
jgi:hypothetical protein